MRYTPKTLFKHFVLLLLSANVMAVNAQELGYFRDPNIHGGKIVFTAQGDLWITTRTSDTAAKRLTTHPNLERSPKFSPSGNKIAFVASYHNIPAVYIISTNGGIAKQVSHELSRSKLHGWVNENTLLISTASDIGMHNSWVLKTIDLDTLGTTILPISDAVEGTISQNGKSLVFIQHGLQVSTDNANHYKGGASGEMWHFSLNNNEEATLLSGKHAGSVRTPMLYTGNNATRIYFISNQSKLDNIWSMNLNGKDLKQHTKFSDWAVRNASVHGGEIAFQHGADIKIFNIATGKVSDIAIQLQSDFVDLRTSYITKPLTHFESASISANGDKTAIVARGKIVVAEADATRIVDVATDPSSRNRDAIVSKDGKSVYAISDASGDYEIWQFDASGGKSAMQLTNGGKRLKTGLWLSPDGKSLAYTENMGNLFLLDIDSKKVSPTNTNLNGTFYDIEFSHDSRYLTATYSPALEDRSRLFLYEIAKDTSTVLTSGKYDSYSPTFSSDLQWLYFLSDRSFTASPSSPWGDRNMGTAFDKRTQIYAIALSQDAKFQFAPPTELDAGKQKTDPDKKTDTDDDDDVTSMNIAFSDLEQDLWQIDIPAGNYTHLIAGEKSLFLRDESELKSIAIEYPARAKSMTKDVEDIDISSDKKHLLITQGKTTKTKLFIVPALPKYPSNASEHEVKLSPWTMVINPQDEWKQLFKDAWLMHRDSFFDPNMRGLDWPATKQKYMPLVARLTERSELNDIFEQMMGELNSLHSQVRGGDLNDDPNAPTQGVLGASYLDTPDGVEIAAIYKSDAEIISQAPPLAKPGVNAQIGDIITAINNRTVSTIAELNKALLNTQGQQTLLSLVRKKQKIQTVVVPANINTESRLRYQHWVANNSSKVSEQNSKIGYLHLYAMGRNDLASFARDFYAQYKKQGLIIDVRRNRGGNIDSIIIEKLLRRAWSFWQYGNGYTGTNMQQAFRGHLVVLADQFTYSDGETFTAGIKALELGTVIGKQTAGAGVWLSGRNRLVDRGIARVAEFPVFSLEGDWLTEGRGISPNIEVDNLPNATFKGKDAQLEAAIALLEKKIANAPVKPLRAKPFGPVEEAANDAKLLTN